MPCRTGDEESCSGLSEELRHEKQRTKNIESCLCALMSELERRNILDEVIDGAADNGSEPGIKAVMVIWVEHKKKDVDRLRADLERYSEHEQDVLFKLLDIRNKQEGKT